ncbi:MAG: cytochrome b [Chitinophagales bacterium]
MIKNDLSKKFSRRTIISHWLTALLILILFPMGKYMHGLAPADKMLFVKIHAILGILVFLITIVRSIAFFKDERPKHLNTGTVITDKLSIWIHNAFYVLLFIISVSGIGVMIAGGYGEALMNGTPDIIKSKEDIPPMPVHGFSTFIMMVLLVLHVLGVAKHYFFAKENALERIM